MESTHYFEKVVPIAVQQACRPWLRTLGSDLRDVLGSCGSV